MKRIIDFSLKIWFYFDCLLAGTMIGMLIIGWNTLNMPTKLMMMLTLALSMHVMEEGVFPGGFHYMYNKGKGSKDADLDCYPMNRIVDMLTNFGGEVFFIIFLIYGVNQRLAVSVFVISLGESLVHLGASVKQNWKWYHTFYNPGFVTTLCGFLPLAVYSLIYLISSQTSLLDWGLGIVYSVIILLINILLTERLFATRGKGYGFNDHRGFYEKYREADK